MRSLVIELCERGRLPDAAIRLGIRRLCAQRLRAEGAHDVGRAHARFRRLLEELGRAPLAVETEAANRQHYELPARFFRQCLGPRLKYSCCYYPSGRESLAEAELAMLELYRRRADLTDGQRILELGCGWGSLALWLAERYPRAHVLGVSNSRSQREHILAEAARRGLSNVAIVTCDINEFDPGERFDRVVSIEMFEHVHNHARLLEAVARWLRPGGKLFVHHFCHRHLMYRFEDAGDDDWMARHFFTGGLMPAADTLLHLQDHLALEERWLVSGTHYQRTANHWLENQDRARAALTPVLRDIYRDDAERWRQRWRIFWMACAELFGFRGGSEWLVAHHRLRLR
jgi:cyclopropane-fatty-acyl-phospholipid synthase